MLTGNTGRAELLRRRGDQTQTEPGADARQPPATAGMIETVLAVGDLGVEAVEVAHVVVVDEHVDELAQAAVVVEQAVGEAGVGGSSAAITSDSDAGLDLDGRWRRRTAGGGWWGFAR